MINYSIVIPTYGRNEFLKDCLRSIDTQTIKPLAVYIIDNNDNPIFSKAVEEIVKSFKSKDINFSYHKGLINSGAVARNHGASLVKTKLVAFLDDDVVVDIDYYEKILEVFKNDSDIVGVQGLDWGFIESYETKINGNFIGQFWLFIENLFEHSSMLKDKRSDLRPSLAVVNPIPNKEFYLESQWISTCAGVFKTSLFEKIEFPKHFVKYSWNEYVYFSYNIYKKNLGTMIYTSQARYRNIPTDAGRVPLKELVYMAEVYDLYIFTDLFNGSLIEKLIYMKSRLGRFLFYFLRTIKRKEFDIGLLMNILGAFYFSFANRKEIKKGNFNCYNTKFPL